MIDQIVGLGMDEKVANLQYGATQAFVYAFTFIGGLFADKILGFRKSLFYGGLLMIAGSLILAFNPHDFFFIGISFNIIGTGFFKPNISTMVGALYKGGDPRRDAGFSLFYSGINIGALLGGYACVSIANGTFLGSWVPEALRWNVAFGLAAIVMTISLLTFVVTKNGLGPIGLSPLEGINQAIAGFSKRRVMEWAVYIGGILAIPFIISAVSNPVYTDYFMYFIGPASLLYLAYEMMKLSKQENYKLLAALLFIVFSVVFWAIFEQAGGSLNIFAKNNLTDKALGGMLTLDPNGVNNSANSFFVIIFAPILGLLWLALGRKSLEPNSVVKFGIGFLFLGLAFYTFYNTRFFADAAGRTPLDMFIVAYFVVTLGELALSPIGLSLMTKLSPNKLQGLMMGMWFLASAYGQYVAGLFGASIVPNEGASNMDKLISYTAGYKQFALYALIAGILLIVISPVVRRLMGDTK
jgi:POT family proton-dependent oligopeptide transporter